MKELIDLLLKLTQDEKLETAQAKEYPDGTIVMDLDSGKLTLKQTENKLSFTYVNNTNTVNPKIALDFKKYVESIPDAIYQDAVENFGFLNELDELLLKCEFNKLEKPERLIALITEFKTMVKSVANEKIKEFKSFL